MKVKKTCNVSMRWHNCVYVCVFVWVGKCECECECVYMCMTVCVCACECVYVCVCYKFKCVPLYIQPPMRTRKYVPRCRSVRSDPPAQSNSFSIAFSLGNSPLHSVNES